MDHRTFGGRKLRPGWLVAAGLGVVLLLALGIPLGSLLYVGVLLLCPLLMMGMRGGGHGHGSEGPPETHHRAHGSARAPAPPDLEGPGTSEEERRR